MGLVAIAAARAAAAGGDAESVVERAQAARESFMMWFAVDTLEYLRRGGRIGAARALLGSTLKIKPILTLDEEIKPIERVRTRKRANERLLDHMRERHADGADAWVVQHIQDPETAEQMVEACRRDLRLRSAVRLGDRPGARRPRRPRADRGRRRAAERPRVALLRR